MVPAQVDPWPGYASRARAPAAASAAAAADRSLHVPATSAALPRTPVVRRASTVPASTTGSEPDRAGTGVTQVDTPRPVTGRAGTVPPPGSVRSASGWDSCMLTSEKTVPPPLLVSGRR